MAPLVTADFVYVYSIQYMHSAALPLYASADLSVGSRHFDAVVQTQKYLLSSNSLALVQRYLLNREPPCLYCTRVLKLQ